VLGNQILDLRLELVGQRVIGGAQIDELGLAALGRHDARRQQRIARRHLLERAVGVPELIGQLAHAPAILAAHQLVGLGQVRDVGDVRIEPILVAGAQLADAGLERAEPAAEFELLRIGDRLPGKHQHGMLKDRRLDLFHHGRIDRPAQIDAGDLADEHRVKLTHADRHSRVLPNQSRSPNSNGSHRAPHGQFRPNSTGSADCQSFMCAQR
jgi:hypothetical protein